MFVQVRAGFMASGADPTTATNRALAAMFGMVQRQASMVSFVSIFQLLGLHVLRDAAADSAHEAAEASGRAGRGALRSC